MVISKNLIKQATKQKRQELINENQYVTENSYIRQIRENYPLEITIREYTEEEFQTLLELSRHIRKKLYFDRYIVLDNAIAHHLGGLQWEEEQWLIESTLFNLNRLLIEKGHKPTEEDLKDYCNQHQLDLKWHPEAVQLAFENMTKKLQEEHKDARSD